MTKHLFIIRGVSGAGKTTIGNILSPNNVAADDFFTDDDGNYNFNPRKLSEAHNWCKGVVEYMMENGCETIAVHNTFTKVSEMVPYIDMAGEYGYTVHSLVVENRHDSGDVHNVPQNTRDKQALQLSKTIKLL